MDLKDKYVLYVTETEDYYPNETWEEVKQMAFEIMEGRIDNSDYAEGDEERDIVADEFRLATKDGVEKLDDEYTLAFLNEWQYEMFRVSDGAQVLMKDFSQVWLEPII